MSEQFPEDERDQRAADVSEQFQPLPGWLADRLLRPEEKVVWVRGPSFQPFCERFVTHPGLFFLALAIGLLVGGGGVMLAQGGEPLIAGFSVLCAVALILISILVLGIACGYFTRLVVTNYRLVVTQGYEVCRSWGIDDLPRSMLHYRDGEAWRPTINLDAVQTLLGGSSQQFSDAKTILTFAKQLDRIQKKRD
jgi:hypothetical protein